MDRFSMDRIRWWHLYGLTWQTQHVKNAWVKHGVPVFSARRKKGGTSGNKGPRVLIWEADSWILSIATGFEFILYSPILHAILLYMPIYILRYPHVSMTAIGFWDIRNFRTNPYEHYVQCSNMGMFPLVMLGAATTQCHVPSFSTVTSLECVVTIKLYPAWS